jgi:hypothetical protein
VVNFVKLEDGPFGVIWLYWPFLWLLSFLLLGLKRASLGTYTGHVTVVEAWVTAAIPGLPARRRLLAHEHDHDGGAGGDRDRHDRGAVAAGAAPTRTAAGSGADLQEPASKHARPIGVTVTYPVDVITDVIALALDRRSVMGVCPAPCLEPFIHPCSTRSSHARGHL